MDHQVCEKLIYKSIGPVAYTDPLLIILNLKVRIGARKMISLPRNAFTLCLVAIVAGSAAFASDTAAAGLDKIKRLAGEWQGKDQDGQPATVSYELTSGGTAVMERLTPGTNPTMVTIYHLDGDKLMLTHYCARNNQPRMRASDIDAGTGTVVFSYLDATNLPFPGTGHMHSLILKNPDPGHLTQEWTWQEGERQSPAVFHFARKK